MTTGMLTRKKSRSGSAHGWRSRCQAGCCSIDNKLLVIDSRQDSWHPGPVAGLALLPLHHWGSENVDLRRLAPGTVVPHHSHPGGEEILVLEGVFQDDHGSYPVGSWLRNPPGSVHRPWSEAGCTIWVKTGHLPSVQGSDGSKA